MTADPRGIVASIEIRTVDRCAGGNDYGFLHLIIGVAIVPEDVDRLLRGSVFLGEDRAGECCGHNSESAESFNRHKGFHLNVVKPS